MSGKERYILQDLGDLLGASLPNDALIEEVEKKYDEFNKKLKLFTGDKRVDHLYLLQRFTDPRNPEIQSKPLPNGSNINSGVLRASWVLHRAWIRALHYRSLYTGHEGHGWDQIKDILQLVWLFHDMEHELIEQDRVPRPEFAVLHDVYISLGKAVVDFTNEVFEETRPQPSDGAYSAKETVLHNFQFVRFEALWKKKGMLWDKLFEHEDKFNVLMGIDHVEDVLVDKRIVEQDEQYILHELMDGTDAPMEKQTISGNPSQISTPQSPVWKRPIRHKQFSVHHPHAQATLFVFHPIASHDPAQLLSCNYTSGCTICASDFEGDESVIRLHCNQLFHYLCIRTYWDMPGQHTSLCPNCRQASWMLHEQVGIRPEVLDVFDNNQVTGNVFARENPDFTLDNCRYMQNERSYVQLSGRWGRPEARYGERGPRNL
ncbi:RPM1-interacting 2 [Hyphodiscus hymeniophilus]|uniref:RPM1-interacting 2 n=1 Tax=Hyphodiscus hymeniophilus TaxID=353542 RepID=A0A9P6VNR0_9HELO|nr:RPM1-interacting 2 [Hyphodiscus hymeniophilus]